MSVRDRNTKLIWFLAANLVLLLVCILALVVLITTYPNFAAPEPSVTPSTTNTQRPTSTSTENPTSTISPTASRTLLPSSTPTISSTPTQTQSPTITPTWTLLPTLTPAKALAYSGAYTLMDWSPEHADYSVSLMVDYPDTLSPEIIEENKDAYYDAYEFAVVAQKEAILRFPDSPQAEGWRWGLAYNLSQMGDPQAGMHYADLIVSGLNRGEVDVFNLYSWFQQKEPRMALYMVELEPISNFIGNFLIEIRGSGSAFIWLLQSASAYQTYPLLSSFDFINNPESNWIIADFDGEDGDESAVYSSPLPEEFSLDAPQVFNLASVPPEEMQFLPSKDIFDVGLEYSNYWRVGFGGLGQTDPVFESVVFPICPVAIQLGYHWNGTYFERIQENFSIETIPDPSDLSYCEVIVDHAANTWGLEASINLMETLLPHWPPDQDEKGKPYPNDAKDEWRYRLGVYYALLGDFETANQIITGVVTDPSVIDSRWIPHAQKFLAAYQNPDDIYKACIDAIDCVPAYAVDYLVDNLSPGTDALQYLWDTGLVTSSSGYFDFENDGESERWFTVRHRPREKLEFWILAENTSGTGALLAGNVDSPQPTIDYVDEAYIAEDSLSLQPAVLLNGSEAFSMQRLPDTGKAYLVGVTLREQWPNRFEEALQTAEDALFAGVAPKVVKEQLTRIQDNPGLLCKPTWSCDKYYYLLGLANELAWDQEEAVEAYQYLWLNYSRSPYTIMARLKLEGEAFVSPTPSSTVTPTTTGTPAPTLSPTPTTSGTIATATPTITGTPPTSTPTSTITQTTSPGPARSSTPTPISTIDTSYPTPILSELPPYP